MWTLHSCGLHLKDKQRLVLIESLALGVPEAMILINSAEAFLQMVRRMGPSVVYDSTLEFYLLKRGSAKGNETTRWRPIACVLKWLVLGRSQRDHGMRLAARTPLPPRLPNPPDDDRSEGYM